MSNGDVLVIRVGPRGRLFSHCQEIVRVLDELERCDPDDEELEAHIEIVDDLTAELVKRGFVTEEDVRRFSK